MNAQQRKALEDVTFPLPAVQDVVNPGRIIERIRAKKAKQERQPKYQASLK